MFNLADLPLLYVILNFVFTPSNAAFNVWDVPEPTAEILITVLLFAFAKVVANFIVFALSKETKYAVPLVNPPIFPPPPFVYVTLCP